MTTYRYDVKRKETRLGCDIIVAVFMCIIMRWFWKLGQRDFRPPHYYAHTNYVTI